MNLQMYSGVSSRKYTREKLIRFDEHKSQTYISHFSLLPLPKMERVPRLILSRGRK